MHIARIRRKAKATDKPMGMTQTAQFFQRVAELLQEGYLLVDCLAMLMPYHAKEPQAVQRQLTAMFESGATIVQLFEAMGMKRHFLLALHLAEQNGELPETLQQISEQMMREQTIRTKWRKTLMYPLILFAFLTMLFIAFRLYFLPQMTAIFQSQTVEDAASVRAASWLLRMPDFLLYSALVAACCGAGFIVYVQRQHVVRQIQLWMKVPFVRTYWQLALTRQFAHSISQLLLTGFTLQQALDVLHKQTVNLQLGYVATLLQQRIIFGDTLAEAVRLAGYFYTRFDVYVAHGEQTGLLGRELRLYAQLLDEQMMQRIERVLQWLQPVLFILIAVCIIAAYLSILLPMYNLIEYV